MLISLAPSHPPYWVRVILYLLPVPMTYLAIGYLLDMHNPDDVDFHFKMTERHGHVARLKGGIIGVSLPCT